MFRLTRWQVVRCAVAVSMVFGLEALGSARTAADLNANAITIQLPADIKWNKGRGSESATLVGDPTKPGMYIVLQKGLPIASSTSSRARGGSRRVRSTTSTR